MNGSVLRYFHPVLPARDLESRPRRVQVAGQPYVLFRGANGAPAALDDHCPHRRAPLSEGKIRPDGRIACGYHGWNFDAEGHGRSPACPELKRCDTVSYHVVERFGFLWLACRETPLSRFPHLGNDGFAFAGYVSTLFEAPIDITLDNISDDEHFAYIHSTFGWNEAQSSEVVVETTCSENCTKAKYVGPQRPAFVGLLAGIRPGDLFHNEWITFFEPVYTIYTFGWRSPRTGESRPILTRAVVFLVPETKGATRAQMFVFIRIDRSLQALLSPFIYRLACWIAGMELERDAAFISHVARAPSKLQGMRLTRFDKALIHNRKLLERIYWRDPEGDPRRVLVSENKDLTKVIATPQVLE